MSQLYIVIVETHTIGPEVDMSDSRVFDNLAMANAHYEEHTWYSNDTTLCEAHFEGGVLMRGKTLREAHCGKERVIE